ncbi:MAG: hypothetical protein JW810_14440 [Sedimentisphaerales bacterium]|nr:hypothetical protein [Sedimentisphaerales bacterium]
MIRFRCPHCQKELELPAAVVPDYLTCPNCRRRVRVPRDPDDDVLVEGPPVSISLSEPVAGIFGDSTESEPHGEDSNHDVIRFKCPCGQMLKASGKYIGHKARCPRCSRRVQVPGGQH